MKKTIGFLLVFALYDAACFAGGGNNASKLLAAWGNGQLSACGTHQLTADNACIGETSNCSNRTIYARNNTDEWAIQMMVAMDITENGARFCPVQVEGKNKNKGNAWTEYAELGSSNCVWLCKEGYTGDKCALSASESKTCDVTELKAANYSSITRVETGANVEDRVPMFVFNKYYGCGDDKGQEHDIILALKRWLPSGHGAVAQQMVVRAERSGWKHMISWATIYPASGAEEILLCKDGYKPNSARTDCEAINAELCQRSQTCNGWGGDDYDSSQHNLVQREGTTCYEFRCKKQGYAFDSATNRTCTECATNLRDGVNPVTGECVKCEVGKIFNKNASNTGYCSDAVAFSKIDMQYGKGATKNTRTLKDQCWV
ncbi:MAG: hypothetical protein ACI4NZ_02830, partial [Candidatus Enterousia sp.]